MRMAGRYLSFRPLHNISPRDAHALRYSISELRWLHGVVNDRSQSDSCQMRWCVGEKKIGPNVLKIPPKKNYVRHACTDSTTMYKVQSFWANELNGPHNWRIGGVLGNYNNGGLTVHCTGPISLFRPSWTYRTVWNKKKITISFKNRFNRIY